MHHSLEALSPRAFPCLVPNSPCAALLRRLGILQGMPHDQEAPAAVTYIGLPISSGGAHSLGRMSRRVAYARTIAFLDACTQPVGAIEYKFAVNDVPELKPVPSLERELARRFGNDARVKAERVSDALDFLDDIDPQPTNQWGMAPIWFWARSKFQVLDPATGRPLPGQNAERFHGVEYQWRVPLGTSSIHLVLHNSASLGIELCIPDANEEVLRRVVPWLQDYLPFKFSPKQWRAWTPTKAGSFKVRKMTAPAGI
jgi:hypothetical protein